MPAYIVMLGGIIHTNMFIIRPLYVLYRTLLAPPKLWFSGLNFPFFVPHLYPPRLGAVVTRNNKPKYRKLQFREILLKAKA